MKVVALKTFCHDGKRLRGDVFEAGSELARSLIGNKLVRLYEEPAAPVEEPAPVEHVPAVEEPSCEDNSNEEASNDSEDETVPHASDAEPLVSVSRAARSRRRRSRS